MSTDIGGEVRGRAVRRILVPVDCSAASEAAIDYAALIGNRFHAEIDVLHVWNPASHADVQDPNPLARFARSNEGHAVADLLETLDREATVPAHGRLAVGEPAAAIVAVASADHYDLIVLGTTGRRRLSGLLHAGVAARVVRRAPCPVLVVHAELAAAARAEPADREAIL